MANISLFVRFVASIDITELTRWYCLHIPDSTEVLLFMQTHFIAGMKISGEDDAGIIPVSSIGSGVDFDFDSAQGYIYYVEKVNVSERRCVMLSTTLQDELC